MRWLFLLALLQAAAVLCAQDQTPSPTPRVETSPQTVQLPDSPGAARTYHQSASVSTPGSQPCKVNDPRTPNIVTTNTDPTAVVPPCTPPLDRNPYQRFLNYPGALALTPRQKGLLAIRDLTDPGNLFTITANAGFTVGIDSHTAYGPGLKGFGRDIGYSLVQDATGEFVSTFVLDSLFHEDPHYHRSPQASVPRRFLHAVRHTVISQHDDGTPMPNYSTLLTYPISAEIANLYVPGVHGNGPSTVARIATGLASDPIDNLITEFLPDFAKRVHIRIVFVQQILNNVSQRPGS
ncbi:hypothetical protein [Granulicella arctica]|uniref:hypothetical protein n=1 Tax=Granulicella arctica TaxID=940613 RepID=UPI0021E05F85|nr:hypothetical protein [Granulicella arctica]